MTGSGIPDPPAAGPNAHDPAAADPTEHSRWRPLRLLQAAMDADIARVHADAQVEGLKPSHVMELLRLHARGPMTITELAESVQLTHSVRTTPGTDARTKKVMLTPKAARMAGQLAAEWRATEAAIAELEAEIPYPLSQVVTDIEEALRRKSFHDRIAEKLAEDDAWK
jgi:DNA-binding MarR family transcriptional regulator